MFNGNHSKMNYTDSVRDLMIYVHNTLEQMSGAGRQLKTGEEQQRGGGELAPQLSAGRARWEAALRTDPALRSVWPSLPGPRLPGWAGRRRRRGLPPC